MPVPTLDNTKAVTVQYTAPSDSVARIICKNWQLYVATFLKIRLFREYCTLQLKYSSIMFRNTETKIIYDWSYSIVLYKDQIMRRQNDQIISLLLLWGTRWETLTYPEFQFSEWFCRKSIIISKWTGQKNSDKIKLCQSYNSWCLKYFWGGTFWLWYNDVVSREVSFAKTMNIYIHIHTHWKQLLLVFFCLTDSSQTCVVFYQAKCACFVYQTR